MKAYMNNVGSPSGPGLHADVEKCTKSNLKAKHKPMKVCSNKKKSKVSDEQGLTKHIERMTNEEKKQRVLILEEEYKNKDNEIRRLIHRLQGYVEASVIKSPNVCKVPLIEEDHKSWFEFKKLDEERSVQDSVCSNEDVKWPLNVDHPFAIVIRDFVTKAFNEVIHMYAKKKEKNILSHSQVMSCEYTKGYYFHMTMEAIEEGLLGVYKVIVACDHIDGSTSLVNLKLTDHKPTGMEHDLKTKLDETRKSIKGKKNKDEVAAELTRQLKIEQKTIKEKCCMLSQQIQSQVSDFRETRTHGRPICVDKFTNGLVKRGGFHGGYNYRSPFLL